MPTVTKKLKANGYHETIPCKWCVHSKMREHAVGSQSFMTVFYCRLADETQVSATGTCDKAKR